MIDMEEKIIGGTLQMYLKYGIKSITMDDVASELGVSKKTIYQFVDNKDNLVQKATEFFAKVDQANIEQVVQNYPDTVEQLVQLCYYGSNVLNNLNPAVIRDLKKFHQSSWGYWVEYKNTFFYGIISSNINSGIDKGVYRDDFDIDIVTKFYLGQIEVIVDDQLFDPMKYRFDVICKQFLEYFIHGISTEKGIHEGKSHIEKIYR